MKSFTRTHEEHLEYVKLIEGNLLRRFSKPKEDEFFAWLSSIIYVKESGN